MKSVAKKAAKKATQRKKKKAEPVVEAAPAKNNSPQPIPARNPNIFYTRAIVETLVNVQKHRIKASNRIGAYTRMGMEESKAKSLHAYLDDRLKDLEGDIKKLVATDVESQPIWEYWLKNVKGIGPALAGKLIAGIEPISRFDNVSKLWRYAGQAVINGKAEKKIKGEVIHWSPSLKTACYLIGEQFVKQGDIYRKIYDDARRYEEGRGTMILNAKTKKEEPITKGHIHARAKRKAVKIFLSHLWLKWREMEGLPITEPFVQKHLGHDGIIPPPSAQCK